MADGDKKATDLLGIAPYGETLKVIAEVSVRTAENFLNRICGPAADEFGLLLRDKVHRWRQANIVNIALQAEKIVNAIPEPKNRTAHPRMIGGNHGCWRLA